MYRWHSVTRLRSRSRAISRTSSPEERGSTPHNASNPYYTQNPTLHLNGIFVSTAEPYRHRRGITARLDLKSPAIAYWLGELITPIVTIDGMAQVAQIADLQAHSANTRLPVPSRVHRIDLYRSVNDVALAASSQPISLHANAAHLTPDGNTVSDNIVAVAHDGTIIARITDLTWNHPRPTKHRRQARQTRPTNDYGRPPTHATSSSSHGRRLCMI